MELKTIDGWNKSGCGDWDTYCKPGELVDEGVADYFLDILPPRTMKKGYFQVGEPHSHAVNQSGNDAELRNICYVRKSRRRHVGVQGTLFSEWIDGGRTLR